MGCKASKEELELEDSMLSVAAVHGSELDSQTLATIPTDDKFVSVDPVLSSENKYSPSIDISSSIHYDSEELKRKTLAISKIQRQARRKKSVREAHTEQQWKMFANLDVQDEAEMLHLAVFMQTLIDLIPTSPRALNGLRSLNCASSETNIIAESNSPTIAAEPGLNGTDYDNNDSEAEQTTEVVLVNSSRKRSKSNIDDSDEYNINSATITIDVVNDIIEVYRRGGRLSRKAILKVLRLTYKLLQKRPNTNAVTVTGQQKLIVVGDLHGQLSDLLHIIDESGLPNASNKYVFNGDFVDRGDHGLEIVIILFAMFANSSDGGDTVFLNRGNHEDAAVCRVYGFENEAKQKYDELVYEMFVEVFRYLPLFTLVNQSVFIVHGGLFHTAGVTLEDLDKIDRTDFNVKPPVPFPDCTMNMSEEEAYGEFLKELQRSALWSDPWERPGCQKSNRGAGYFFGSDITRKFMMLNDLDMVVRSHEVVNSGFELPYANSELHLSPVSEKTPKFFVNTPLNKTKTIKVNNVPGQPLLCTLFSASNYQDGNNSGAFVVFCAHPFSDSVPAVDLTLTTNSFRDPSLPPRLHLCAYQYKTSESDIGKIEDTNYKSLHDMVLKKKSALSSAFEAADTSNLGIVTRVEWAEIMQRVMNIKIRWLSIISSIAPVQCLSPTSVAYRLFLASFAVTKTGSAGAGLGENKEVLMEALYGQRKKLESIFYFFDVNGDGVITREEFTSGCAILNQSLHPDCQLTQIEHTLDLMDFDGNGTIDMNEFFETFRILDAKDGKVDGVISIASNHKINRL